MTNANASHASRPALPARDTSPPRYTSPLEPRGKVTSVKFSVISERLGNAARDYYASVRNARTNRHIVSTKHASRALANAEIRGWTAAPDTIPAPTRHTGAKPRYAVA